MYVIDGNITICIRRPYCPTVTILCDIEHVRMSVYRCLWISALAPPLVDPLGEAAGEVGVGEEGRLMLTITLQI